MLARVELTSFYLQVELQMVLSHLTLCPLVIASVSVALPSLTSSQSSVSTSSLPEVVRVHNTMNLQDFDLHSVYVLHAGSVV